MSESLRTNERSASPLGGEPAILPGDPEFSKLPMPAIRADAGQAVSPAVLEAWTQQMVNGFRQNEQMFKNTLGAFMKPYRLTIGLYLCLFGVGLGLFIVAAAIGLRNGSSVVAVVFAGLGGTAFLAFFVRQPLQALEENLECITWLGVAFNTYWTRLMYMSDPKTVQAELKAAEDDFRVSVDQLIAKHADLRGKRPGGS
jgi:hypothetical protein